jgi:hypothetical protein
MIERNLFKVHLEEPLQSTPRGTSSKYTSPIGSHAELLCRVRYAPLNIRTEDEMGGKSNTNDSGYGLYLPSSMTALVNGREHRIVQHRLDYPCDDPLRCREGLSRASSVVRFQRCYGMPLCHLSLRNIRVVGGNGNQILTRASRNQLGRSGAITEGVQRSLGETRQ